jgi:hypothetical protein
MFAMEITPCERCGRRGLRRRGVGDGRLLASCQHCRAENWFRYEILDGLETAAVHELGGSMPSSLLDPLDQADRPGPHAARARRTRWHRGQVRQRNRARHARRSGLDPACRGGAGLQLRLDIVFRHREEQDRSDIPPRVEEVWWALAKLPVEVQTKIVAIVRDILELTRDASR